MKKRIISDIILNMFASFIPIFALQFLILPQVASKVSAESYGQILSIVAFMNLSVSAFGSALSNSRLIHFKKYEELKIQGDFNILLVVSIIGNVIIMIAGLLYYGKSLQLVSLGLILLSSILFLLKTYLSVEFRIRLNFKYILLNSVLLFLGYLIGFILFLFTGFWIIIYLCGFGLSVIFIVSKTEIWKESFIKSPLFKSTAVDTIMLFGSGIMVSLGIYIDKLIIFPLIGGIAVSIYYTASILGKTIALVIGPITSVLLSYLAQMKTFSKHNFKLLLLISSILGIIGYWIVLLLSKPFLTIVYPQFVDEALKYIPITTSSIIIIIIGNVLNPVLLKFCSPKWQIFTNGVYMLVYIPISVWLLNMYGLIGFCYGALFAAVVKIGIMITVYYVNRKSFV